MTTSDLVPISVLLLDWSAPAGIDVEQHLVANLGLVVVDDPAGRRAISCEDAKRLLDEQRQRQEVAARRLQEIERRAVEADQRFRAGLPAGLPATSVPDGITPGQLLMLSDPIPGSRRQSMVEHALSHPAGALVFHPIREESP